MCMHVSFNYAASRTQQHLTVTGWMTPLWDTYASGLAFLIDDLIGSGVDAKSLILTYGDALEFWHTKEDMQAVFVDDGDILENKERIIRYAISKNSSSGQSR